MFTTNNGRLLNKERKWRLAYSREEHLLFDHKQDLIVVKGTHRHCWNNSIAKHLQFQWSFCKQCTSTQAYSKYMQTTLYMKHTWAVRQHDCHHSLLQGNFQSTWTSLRLSALLHELKVIQPSSFHIFKILNEAALQANLRNHILN